jgi:4-amino-4-deoxy-L-arabinose transferase-like glycosyltransferase
MSMTPKPRLTRLAPAAAAAAPVRSRPAAPLDAPRSRRLTVPLPELGALLVLAGLLNLWALDRNGWANQYYAAAVRSMSSSWHNFLYASFDPSGVMTVDKPPLAFWVQALSVKVFGFHSLSILVPQALMGVATVALVYDLTRRQWGRPAGFVAGLVLAVTPMTVAISRHNNPDALLVLCCAAALWCIVRALQDGRTRWLVLAGVSVGLGFETKMGAALLVVPALAAAWLWYAPRGRLAALRQLLAGGAAMVAVGGAWPLLVALTPASSRPWISGTSDNSILSLILDYNGLGRLDGQLGGPQGIGGGPGGGGTFGGASGPLRLLNEALGGQAGWLLGFAVVALIALAIATRLRRADRRSAWLIATGGTFAITAVAFSEAQGIFHPYYVAQLAPFSAALVGAGSGWFLAHRRAWFAAALAIAAGVATELAVLHDNPGQLTWLPAVLVGLGVAVVVALAAARTPAVRAAVLAAALGLLLLAPASWAVQTLGHASNGTFPAGGPAATGFGGGPGGGRGGAPDGGRGGPLGGGAPPAGGGALGGLPPGGIGGGALRGPGGAGVGGFGGDGAGLTQALQYVRRNGSGTIAVSSQSGAAATIIRSGSDVAGIGGFSGRESEVNASWLAEMVRSGRIRWVVASGTGGGFGGADGRVGSSKVMAAVERVGNKVSVSGGTSGATVTLYDLSGRADALAAAAQ